MKSLFSRLIPDPLKKDALTHSYAKNLSAAVLTASLAAPAYAFLYYWLNFPQASVVILISWAGIIFSLLLMRYTSSLRMARELMIFSCFAGIVWLSYYLGGINSPICFWFILPPLLAIFFGSITSGIVWTLISLATTFCLFWLDYEHFPTPISHIQNLLVLQVTALCGLIVIILCLVYLFELGKRETTQESRLAAKRLQLAKDEAEELAKRADVANRLKTEFLANMSHELRTPLNGIIGFAELIHSGKAGPILEEQKEYLQDILTSAQHLLQLINDILDLAKIESGKMVFHPELVKIRELCFESTDILNTLIHEKRLHLEMDISPNLPEIITDPRKFKQILYNFLSNAVKFTPDEGKISVRVYTLGKSQFKLEVIDNGIGIRESDLNKLFVEFQQLDSGLSKKYQGTGLGLALTQQIVEAQGGYVGVESIYGKGSKFFAILPCKPRGSR